MGAKIEHLDKEALQYFAREFQKQMLEHIMCQDASNFYETQYHNLFSTKYETRWNAAGGSYSSNAYWQDSTSTNYKMSVLLVKIEKHPITKEEQEENEEYMAKYPSAPYPPNRTDANGCVTKETELTLTNVEGMMGDSEPLEPSKSAKLWSYYYPKTFYRDKDYKSGWSKSFSATAYGLDGGKEVKGTTISCNCSFSINPKPNLWFNNLKAEDITADWFEETTHVMLDSSHKFTTGKDKAFQTVQDYPLIFLSTSSNLNFEQSGNSIIRTKTSISTYLGTYYVYITGPGNGNVWNNMTIS